MIVYLGLLGAGAFLYGANTGALFGTVTSAVLAGGGGAHLLGIIVGTAIAATGWGEDGLRTGEGARSTVSTVGKSYVAE